MGIWRKLHPLLLSTWLVLHVVAGLALLSGYAVSNIPGMSWSLQEIYHRVKTRQDVLNWLPTQLHTTLIAVWLFTSIALFAASYVMNRLCARFCVADYVVEAFRWTVLSARVRFLLALPLGLAAASLAIPILIVPVWIVSSVVLALTVYQPFLSDQQLPRDLKSVSGATRGLLRLTLVALAYVGISLGGWWLIRQSTEPILYVASVFWYVLEFSVDALLLASAIYGFGLIRGLADLRRFFSIRYLVTWLRLDYFMALAALWLAPPIVLLAFFMWFAYPAIRFQAQVNGESVSFWLRLMAGTADAFSKFGILSLMPAAFVLGTLLHAKIVSELERDVIQIRG